MMQSLARERDADVELRILKWPLRFKSGAPEQRLDGLR